MSMVVVWLGILILMLVIELATMGLATIWFAGGALVSCLLALVGLPIWAQVVAFFVVSAVLLWFTRPILVKHFNRARKRTNIESMIGREAIAMTEINNLEETGTIKIGGIEWMARAKDKGSVIPAGSVVEIVAVEGVKLYVKLVEK